MLPSPTQLIVHLLSAAAPATVRAGALVTAGEIFGYTSNLVRVTLTRLVGRGLVENVRRGEYALGSSARAVQAGVSAWRRDEGELFMRWDGRSWLAAMGVGGASPVVRVLGMRELVPGLVARPANRRGGASGVRERLEAAGLAASTFVISELDPELEVRARELWDAQRLVDEHTDLEHRLRESMARVRRAKTDDASLRETYALGSAAIRALTLDPHLPEELCPGEARRALRATMIRYDAFGLALWSARLGHSFEGTHSAPWSVEEGV